MEASKIREIVQVSPSKIVFLIIDGLGGLPHPQTGKTELETASTPNLDQLCQKGSCGLVHPIAPGITPGSAPGIFSLLGYDPLKYEIGRGVMEALGIDFELKEGDIAIRGNFCTQDKDGIIIDRRAGRISTEDNNRLCHLLSQIKLSGAELFVKPVKEHRFVLVLRGEGLGEEVSSSDPQKEGLPPLPIKPLSSNSQKTAELANEFVSQAKEILRHSHPANMVLLRGFSKLPHLSSLNQLFGLKPAAIATYPMYRGLAKLVGMSILPTGSTIKDEFTALRDNFAHYDFFFLHIKQTDIAGEDGDFERKVKIIEEIDSFIPQILELNPDVLVITADHSTPAVLRSHSWHPVPILLLSPWCRPDGIDKFSERRCSQGGLGQLRGIEVMPLALAYALKLSKFGA